MIRKFEVEVISTNRYEVHIDDEKYTPEELENWSSVFHDVDNLEDFVGHFASSVVAHGGSENMGEMEGYGPIKILDFNGNQVWHQTFASQDKFDKGLVLKVIEEGDDISTLIERIE